MGIKVNSLFVISLLLLFVLSSSSKLKNVKKSSNLKHKAHKQIKIEKNDTEEVYGNLKEISVLTGEKVGKGDIIGTFDSRLNKEFIYQKN